MLCSFSLEHRRRQAARPLVEIAEHHLRPRDPAIVDERGQPNRLMTTLAQRRAEVHVIQVHGVIAHGQIDPLTATRLAPVPRQVELRMLANWQAAEHDVAEEVSPQPSRRRHDPAHAECRAEFLGMARVARVRSDDLLERDHVGVDVGEHGGDSRRVDPSIEAPAAMNVVGGDAQIDVASMRGHACAMDVHPCRSKIIHPFSRKPGPPAHHAD